MSEDASRITLTVDAISDVIFSLLQVSRDLIERVVIENNTDKSYENAVLKISSVTNFLNDATFDITLIPAGESVEVDCSEVTANPNEILKLTEMTTDVINFDLIVEDQCIAQTHAEMTFLAFDQWCGIPDFIPAFVTPNHPLLSQVLVSASDYLKEWTGSPSLDGYQSGDWQRVRFQAAAIFRALQELSIVYINPPASFGAGQRVRLVDTVLEQHMATCLDFSILYASCLEAIGLRPLLILIKGHMYAGVWLEEDSFPEICEEDSSALSKRCAQGVNQMTVVECTMIAKDKKATFDDAEQVAMNRLSDFSTFECAIDVYRARQAQVLPLPNRIKSLDGWEVEISPNDSLEPAVAPEKSDVSTAVLDVKDEPLTKKQIWERSLLDLSLRNNLLNMRMGASAMTILVSSIDELEDALAHDKDLTILPKSDDFPEIDDKDAFGIRCIYGVDDLLRTEFQEGRLRTAFSKSQLEKNLSNLFRSSHSAIEETGANTLFLTMGTLKWCDSKRNNEIHCAPLMLFPVDISRQSANSGYTIRLRDDEPQINFSLLEMLRTEYDISIEGLDPLPTDDAGVDTRLVLNTFASRIMDQPNWEIYEDAVLGLFSFAQFVMWNDIRNREDDLRQSKIVNSMMEGHLTWQVEPLDPDEGIDPDELLLPVELDSSQMLAVKAALDGKSFVMHGPPGTGKSQTITAIIANMLAAGKKVLFVAEKMAALEVVQKRLDALGIDPFVLEAFSTKATKNHVFDQIQTACEVGRAEDRSQYEHKLAEVHALREELDSYAQDLRTTNKAGLSLREQICRYQGLLGEADPLMVPSSFVNDIESPDDFAQKMNSAERLVMMARPFAPLRKNPLYFVTSGNYSQSLRRDVPQALDSYIEACESLKTALDALPDILKERRFASWDDLSLLEQDISSELSSAQIPPEWCDVSNRQALLNNIEDVANKAYELAELKESLSKKWDPSFFEIDVNDLRQSWIDAMSKGVFGKGKAVSKVVNTLSFASKNGISENDVELAIKELERYRSLGSQLEEGEQHIEAYLEGFRKAGSYDWDSVMQKVDEVRRIDGKAQGRGSSQADREAMRGIDSAQLNEFCTCLEKAEELYDTVRDLLGSAPAMPPTTALGTSANSVDNMPEEEPDQTCANWITWQIDGYKNVRDHLDGLRDWMVFNDALSDISDMNLDVLIDYLEDHKATDDVTDLFACGVYRTMCALSIDAAQTMNAFSQSQFDALINQYTRADVELRDLAKQEIYYRIAAQTPDLTNEAAADPQTVRLQKALRSRGRGISIRSLISEMGDLIRGLCPCFLMSPLSVSAYLEPGCDQFDLIIFDEASQLQTCKAIGALSRAENAIIVGDPRQMPPTSFFQGKQTDEDFEELDDLESVLEDCLALNLPQTYLQWHYRSQHESLITFSNKKFYESKMFTFPSADDRKSRVEFVYVGGTFERGSGKRVNKVEAEAIIEDLKKRAHDPELIKRSVGIITFNIPQMKLVDDLFQKACSEDAELDKWAHSGEEPLFIKNLENVQGDERDDILFSVTYGPDQEGKLSMNFGPINREGGWRRLNVAVTRARVSMKVFSSMKPTDIDLNRTTSSGPSSLKAFLEFAQKGSFASVSADGSSVEPAADAIGEAVCEFLENEGFATKRNVGSSLFRVDVGVVDPDYPDRYIVGILLDGSSYEIAHSTRDREIAQPELLKKLGWNVYRIWAIDWWENKDMVLDNLKLYLEEVRSERQPATVKEAEEELDKTAVGDAGTEDSEIDEADEAGKIDDAGVVDKADDEIDEGGVIDEVSPTHKADETDKASEVDAVDETCEADEAAEAAEPAYDESRDLLVSVSVEDENANLSDTEESKQDLAASNSQNIVQLMPSNEQDITDPALTCTKTTYEVAPLELTQVSDASEFFNISNADIAKVMESVIATEAPIDQALLYRRVARAYGIAKIGTRIQNKLDAAFKKVKCTKTRQSGRTIAWRKDQDPKAYLTYRVSTNEEDKRAFNEIPPEEIIAAALSVLDKKSTMKLDELVKETTVELGYKRLTSAVSDFAKKAISLAARRGLITKDGNICSLSVS